MNRGGGKNLAPLDSYNFISYATVPQSNTRPYLSGSSISSASSSRTYSPFASMRPRQLVIGVSPTLQKPISSMKRPELTERRTETVRCDRSSCSAIHATMRAKDLANPTSSRQQASTTCPLAFSSNATIRHAAIFPCSSINIDDKHCSFVIAS